MNIFKVGDLVTNSDNFNTAISSITGELDECYKRVGEVIKVTNGYCEVWWPQLNKNKIYHPGNLKPLK